MLKLEAGKRYLNRDGTLSGALSVHEDGGCYVWWDGEFYYTSGGRILRNQENSADIITETAAPEPDRDIRQPLEWKRGIPTEEECRECWIVGAGNYSNPHDGGAVLQPGSYTEAQHWSSNGWYLPLRIKPVELPKPKTRTVTQRKYTTKFGEEMWTDQVVFRASGWIDTDETRTVEVPCE